MDRHKIALVVSDQHEVLDIREKGHKECPARIGSILRSLEKTDLFVLVPPRHFPEDHIHEVHDPGYVRYLRRICQVLKPGKLVHPYICPPRNLWLNEAEPRMPRDLELRAGYYCMDTSAPLHHGVYRAARRAVDCALTAATQLLEGSRAAYALVRPPGHHVERRTFGGYCYLNNAAIAAHYLSPHGKVAMLDIDYHHGNGQQAIFYRRNDVLTVSIHGQPAIAYPYFTGFADERGDGPGYGYNINYPLPEHVDGPRYLRALDRALRDIRRFEPAYLVVCLGLDTAKGDPSGSWSLGGNDYAEIGRRIGGLALPTLVIQEGGYNRRTLGANARRFFQGLWEGSEKVMGGE